MISYRLQAYAVKMEMDRHLNHGESIDALQDAITTLNAAALTKEKLSITDDLIKIAQEFSADAPSMNLTEIVQYQNDFRRILDKLK